MPATLRNLAKYLLFPLLVALAVFLAAFFYFNRGNGYAPPAEAEFPYEALTQKTSITGPSGFVDQPPASVRRGIVAVDSAHRNGFQKVELTTLLSRVTNRGYSVEFLSEFELLDKFASGSLLEEGLPRADSLVIIGPRDPYSRSEIASVQRFVEQGGRVLLIADPTRSHDINSIAAPLGLEFQPDYLFNQEEYDLNFQHIILREFQPDPVTVGLNEVVLYTAGSIKTSGGGLVFPSDSTRSSLLADLGGTAPIATGNDRDVLGVADLTFLVPPHNSFVDNDRLISNLADFLTGGQRQFSLGDFPHFFKEDVDILLGDPSLFDTGTSLKSALAAVQVPSQLVQQEDSAVDTIFLGLYDDADQVASYLQTNGVRVNDTVTIPSAPEIDRSGAGVIALHRSQDRHVLVVLADSNETLSTVTDYLIVGYFRDGLVNENVGVYKTK